MMKREITYSDWSHLIKLVEQAYDWEKVKQSQCQLSYTHHTNECLTDGFILAKLEQEPCPYKNFLFAC